MKIFSLLTLDKVRFCGYLMHSDLLILELWFAVFAQDVIVNSSFA